MRRVAASPTLVLLCKRPAPGYGKQRLARALGTGPAWRLARRLLACALEDLRAWPGPVVIAPAGARQARWARACVPAARCLPQGPGNLGVRLQGLDRRLRREGHRRLVFIGSDAPTLTPDDYLAVRQGLARHDCLLAPARDGGVVLMASRRPWPALAALPWSSGRLGTALADACHRAGRTLDWGAERCDVDRAADLPAVAAALHGDPRPARRRLLAALGPWREPAP